MALRGSTNEEKIWNYLRSRGFNEFPCAGILGNLYAESNLNPKNLQNTYENKLGFSDHTYCEAVDNKEYDNFVHDGAAFGICQWKHYSRKQGLLNLSNDTHRSIGDLELQLDYLMEELKGTYKKVFNELKTCTSIKEASDIFLIKFEKPSNTSESVCLKRASYAEKYFNQLSKQQTEEKLELEGKTMKIKVEKLLDLFETMLEEHWSYVWGAARKGCVDCSGAFVYAYKVLSNGELSIYHGSNRIARKYVGKLQSIKNAKAGYAAFKWKKTGEPETYTDGKGNYYHIGLVDETGKYVLNAKSAQKGFSRDPIDSWDYVAPLNAVDYADYESNNDKIEDNIIDYDKDTLYFAYVDTVYGKLNIRNQPNGKRIGKIPRSVLVDVLDDSDKAWWLIRYDRLTGYADTSYLMKLQGKFPYNVRVTVDSLNMRSDAGVKNDLIGRIYHGGTYAIVDERDGWGKLKSNGAWIDLRYTEKV